MRPILLAAALASLAAPAIAQPRLEMCTPGQRNTPDKTCVVDGDTIWLQGENYRLVGYDTPEPQTGICGGEAEVALARQASVRLLELLNTNAWQIEVHDGTAGFGRGAATIWIDGRDVGDILIDERLARAWPDGDEWWC